MPIPEYGIVEIESPQPNKKIYQRLSPNRLGLFLLVGACVEHSGSKFNLDQNNLKVRGAWNFLTDCGRLLVAMSGHQNVS